jgi:spore maturation protein CgeB
MRILVLTRLDQYETYFLGSNKGSETVPELPESQGQYFWIEALRNLGHNVEVVRYTDPVFPSPRRSAKLQVWAKQTFGIGYRAALKLRQSLPTRIDPEYQARNRRIVDRIEAFDPQLLLVVGGYHQLRANTFERIQANCDTTIIGMSGIGPFDYGTPTERSIAPRHYDAMFVNDDHRMHAWRGVGANAEVLPVSAAPIEFARRNCSQNNKFAADVSFIGQPYPRRVEYLEPLADLKIDLALYGAGWEETPLAEYHRGSAWGSDMIQAIYNSKMSVNIHHRVMLTGGNMKQFEIPAAKTLQIADACGASWFEDDEEIVLVDSPIELQEAVEYYLDADEEREQIAIAGHERAASDHTYQDRMREVIERVRTGVGRPDGVVNPHYLRYD